MEQKDDFESLLKGVAARYDEELHSDKPVSEMIDARMVAGKSRLIQSLTKEIVIIVITMGLLLFVFMPVLKHTFSEPYKIVVLKLMCTLPLLYFVAGIILYVWLIRLSFSEKGMDMRKYITLLHKRTTLALKGYLWLSTTINSSCIPLMLLLFYKASYYWIPGVVISTVLIHYSNIWYINKRFGKGLRELETLIAEFK